MKRKLRIAVAGLGRMGMIHALHAHELTRDSEDCELAAVAEIDAEHARRFTDEIGREIPVLPSIKELAKARVCDATVIVTPTDRHREHAAMMIAAGNRVLLEKP